MKQAHYSLSDDSTTESMRDVNNPYSTQHDLTSLFISKMGPLRPQHPVPQ